MRNRRASTYLSILAVAGVLTSCAATEAEKLAPVSASSPLKGSADFTLEADPRVVETRAPLADSSREYSLPELIDVAQRNHPETRAAWLRARAAAQAVGVAESTYLPEINAQIVAGVQHTSNPAVRDPLGLLPDGSVSLDATEAAAIVSARWLLFDFGLREAAVAGAKELQFASNVGFTGAHQKLIFDVTQAYYDLYAAQRREEIHRARLASARTIEASVQAQLKQGIATELGLAQARQFVAQAKFDLARVHSETAIAQAKLSTEVGVAAGQRLRPEYPKRIKLPAQPPTAVDTYIANALQRRPDLQAAFARVRVSEAHTEAVKAEFRPKIIAAANAGHTFGSARVNDDRFPGDVSVDDDRPVAGAFIGVSIPIWDGGARSRRLKMANDETDTAQAEAEGLRNLAEGEIIGAYELLKASLAANQAAAELIATANIGLDAAQQSSAVGLATIGDVNAAMKLKYDAQLSQLEAQQSALKAAATIAFATGQAGRR